MQNWAVLKGWKKLHKNTLMEIELLMLNLNMYEQIRFESNGGQRIFSK